MTQRRPQKGQAATDPRVHGGTREGSGGRSRGSAAGFSGLHPAWVYLPAPDRRRRLCAAPQTRQTRGVGETVANTTVPSPHPIPRLCAPADPRQRRSGAVSERHRASAAIPEVSSVQHPCFPGVGGGGLGKRGEKQPRRAGGYRRRKRPGGRYRRVRGRSSGPWPARVRGPALEPRRRLRSAVLTAQPPTTLPNIGKAVLNSLNAFKTQSLEP